MPWDHRWIEANRATGPGTPAGAAPMPPAPPSRLPPYPPPEGPHGETGVSPGPEGVGGRAGRHRVRWRAPRQPGPLRRSRTNRMAAGVAGGLSARIGVDANLIRVGFVLLVVGGGTGVALYVLAWLFIPREGDATSIARRALGDRRAVTLALGLGTLFAVALVVVTALGFQWAGGLIWPLSLGAAGLVFVWFGAEDDEKAFLQELVGNTASVGRDYYCSGERARKCERINRHVADK